MSRIRTMAATAAAAAALAVPAGAAHAGIVPFPGAPEQGALAALCQAREGSFHVVNTYGGTNLLCSAPQVQAGFTAEQQLCHHRGGEWWTTPTYDGRASWACLRVTA